MSKLEQPSTLGRRERNKVRLDFDVWLAKRARKYHVDSAQVAAVVIKSEAVAPQVRDMLASATRLPYAASDIDSRSESNKGQNLTSGGPNGEDRVASRLSGGSGTVASIPPATVAQTVPEDMPVLIVAAGGGAVETPATNTEPPAPRAADPLRSESPTGGPATVEPSPAPSGLTLMARLRALHAQHPEWTAGQYAKAMPDAKYDSIASTLTMVRREARQSLAKAQEPAPAPKSAPIPERPPEPARQPVASTPGAILVAPMRRGPKGTQFWLRNDAGEYLNRFCNGFTRDRRDAWSGSQDQLGACQRHFIIARDLVERAVEKEQTRAVA